MASLPEQITKDLDGLVQDACADSTSLPCAGAVVVGNGTRWATGLFEHVDGQADVYWLASCTKLVTSIACMQLVEKGVLSLDDADQLERLCPELKDVKVVDENGALTEKRGRITLRMLLSHTAGFGYSFLCPSLAKYRGQTPFDEFSGSEQDLLQPLVHHPGEAFHYGISHDWAGILLERATGTRLNGYMKTNIFEPLAISDLTMFPSSDLQKRLAGIWHRNEDGTLEPRAFPLSRPLNDSGSDVLNSGGAGLYGTLKDYSKILSMLLNHGKSPATHAQILHPATVQALFTNQLPHNPDFARRPLPTCKPDVATPAPELYPLCPPAKPQGWGLGTMLSPGVTGRSDSTAHWCGVSNVYWWCDVDKGVAGIVGSQVLPFVDTGSVELWAKVETKVYEGVDSV